jgi:glycosyltransferase involved in cell wall biosynthesis
MKIAYLSSHYPATTHSFIRREILGLERLGVEVLRSSIRKCTEALPDQGDRDELERTFAVLDRGAVRLLLDLAVLGFTRPFSWLRAAALAVEFGWRSHSGLLRHLIYFVEACTMVRFLRRRGAEHLHAHFGTNPTMVALLARALGGPPYSFTIHGPGEWDSPELLHLREKVARSEFVVAITDFARAQTYRWADPDDWRKVHVVRCAVDGGFLDTPVSPVPEEPRLVCVGRLGNSKGHVLLIEAAARLRQEGLHFEITLVGDGPLRIRLQKLIDEHGLQDTVKIAGWGSGARIRREMLAARALVLPSFGEGLPVAIMEALALARPVISTNIAGIPELVINGENGWLITAGSLEKLVAAIREALQAPVERLQAMGEAGRRAVQEKHNYLVEAERLANLFTKNNRQSVSRRLARHISPLQKSSFRPTK